MGKVIPVGRSAPSLASARAVRLAAPDTRYSLPSPPAAPAASRRGRLLSTAGSLGAAIVLALLLVLVPAVVGRIGGADAWWLVPFVMLTLLGGATVAVVLAGRGETRPPRRRG